MTYSAWKISAIMAFIGWGICLIVIGAQIYFGQGQESTFKKGLDACKDTIDRQLLIMQAGATMLNSGASALETSSRMNYFLDQGIRMQQIADTLEEVHRTMGRNGSEHRLPVVNIDECEGQ